MTITVNRDVSFKASSSTLASLIKTLVWEFAEIAIIQSLGWRVKI